MATSFEHRALVEQLRALSQKRAENPSEKILNTSHPSGSDSAADDHTTPAVVGHRYAENTADSKAMYPKSPAAAKPADAGSEQEDAGNNKGVKVRPSGEAPEVERKYNLNDHNDPGSSHPSGKKAADEFIAEARNLAAELRNLIKASAGDAYVSGDVGEEAKDTKKKDAKGTSEYPANADNHGNIPLSEEQGKNAAEQLAAVRAQAEREAIAMRENLKQSAARDAASFIEAVTTVMDKFAAPHVLPALEAQKQAADAAVANDLAEKIAMYDILAQRDGLPKFAEMMEGGKDDSKPAPKATKKPDADGDGVPDWADKKPGKDDSKEATLKALKKATAELEAELAAEGKKEGSSRKGRTFRKLSEEVKEEGEEEGEEAPEGESEEEISQDEEQAAEQALADMASMPAGGGAPDMMAGMPGVGEAVPAEGAEAQLSPEEEAALMALMQQEGMKESDVKAFAQASDMIANGKLDLTKLSSDQVNFLHACDGAVKRAGAKFQTLRSASRLRNELNSIYKGIQS